MRRIFNIFSLVFLLITSSCIKEDLDQCKPPYSSHIKFTYLADGQDNVIADYAEEIDLLVFDKTTGNKVKTIIYPGHSNGNFKSDINLDLEPGNYTLVAWANVSDISIFSDHNHIDEVTISTLFQMNDLTLLTNDSLYFGRTDLEVLDNSTNKASIRMYSAHVDVEVTVVGDIGTPDVFAEDLVSKLDMNMNPNSTVAQTCYPMIHKHTDRPIFKSAFTALRHHEGFQSTITVTSSSGKSVSINTREYMQKYFPEISTAIHQEFVVKIGVEFSKLGVTVKVPDWDIDETIPGVE